MKEILSKIANSTTLPKQVISGIVVGGIFMLVAYLWQDIYYRYIDTREYLSIDSPISVGATYYEPGDLVSVNAGVEAQIDIQAVVLTELVLVQAETGNYARVDGSQIVQEAPFRKADHHIVTTYLRLPDPLEDGTYYWKGNACYEIRGYERCESYISETFNVSKTGLSPAGERLQDQIDELK